MGGFNQTYRQASGEDNDLSYKVLQAGHRIYFQRRALVAHDHPVRLGRYLKEQFRHGFWRVKMYRDHPGMAGGDGYTFWKDIAEIPLALGCVAGLGAAAVRGVSLKDVAGFIWLPFLVFEILFGCFVIRGFFDGIFLGFVFFLRGFARAFGFSTGILWVFLEKRQKILK